MDVTVLTITYRPGYIDTMFEALLVQTLDKAKWEWVLVDDLYSLRHEAVARHINGRANLVHLPPREVKPYSATAIALNTGLAAAHGELVYFMADYMYPHMTCLERHWDIYQRHGPKVLISGPIIDLITFFGASIWEGAPPTPRTVQVGADFITYEEHCPPIAWPRLKNNWSEAVPDNLISIWVEPYFLPWPKSFGVDWRMGYIRKFSWEPWLCAADLSSPEGRNWWWAGRNDSAPLQLLRDAGGLEEKKQSQHGGLEVELAQRMFTMGAVHLIDLQAPAMHLEHLSRKPETPR